MEDQGIDRATIQDRWGAKVADLVEEVTDDKRLLKPVRKQKQVESAPKKSFGAKIIKLADKTSNLRALASSPPADWPVERRLEYVAWAERVVSGLRGANATLEDLFDEAVRAATASATEISPK